jgi:hypothetical protein
MEQFMEALSGSRYTYYDEFEHILFVWHGGTMIRIFNLEGIECECFNMDISGAEVSDVQDAIANYVAAHHEDVYEERRCINDMSDDGEALASAGMGTNEDYGYYGSDD